ncbi:MAG: hypothetical protein JRH10_10195, partial [Deltaproteobacteria bacterium]|nr:hypothetical protein [Deltaproteobacteria bacterium]
MVRRQWIFLAVLLWVTAAGARADDLGGDAPMLVPDAAAADSGAVEPMGSPEPAPGPADPAAPAEDAAMIDLSLADAMALAIENNLNVQVARHDPLIAWERTRIAWGAYDPVASIESIRSDTETRFASALQATPGAAGTTPVALVEDEVWHNEGSLGGILPVLSTQYELSFSGDKTKTNRSISSLREQWTSGLTFSFTQPLLRNLYWNQPWT